MKEALIARNAFAAGHSGYVMALKNTGAALSDYGHGEADNPQSFQSPHHQTHNTTVDHPNPQPHMENLPPPPPPLPNFSPSPLKRSVTMPEFSVSKTGRKINSIAINEEEDEVVGEDGDDGGGGLRLRGRSRRNGSKGVENEHAPPSPSPPVTPVPVPPPPPPLSESKGGGAWDYFFMVENMPGLSELDEVDDDGNEEIEGHGFDGRENVGNNGGAAAAAVGGGGGMGSLGREIDGIEPKTPEKVMEKVDEEEEEVTPVQKANGKQFVHANSAPPELRRGSKVLSSVNLMKLLEEIDDHFLKASESAQEVSKMLEATRLHYHSNFADNRGHIDHSARVMRVITWNRSFRGVPNGEGARDDLDSEEYETHATVLDKLLAWEKKLYDEVKAGELMKLEYQRKVALLNKQKKRGASAESLEKTKAAVSHLHTRYIVDVQSMDSTVSEVNQIRDSQLYPKLVALADGMANMWQSMSMHHDSQLKIVTDLKALDIANASKETSQHHHERTIQLWNVIQEWHSQIEKLVTHQKQYIQSLNSWLKLNLIPIESSLREKVSSPPRIQHPPIQTLLHSWNDCLEKLPDELAKASIASFAAVIRTIIIHQEEEMKLKDKCEETRKEFLRKSQTFDEWYQKYMQRRTPNDEMDPERGDDTTTKDPVAEKQFVVESLKKRLDDEVEALQRQCLQVREKSLGSLKTRLPELFRAMSDYAHACCDAYERLRFISQSQKQNGGTS